jgi:hypothetical protein
VKHLILNRTFSSEFLKTFSGTFILRQDIEEKLANKHKVYSNDLLETLNDQFLIAMKPKQKSPALLNKEQSKGTVYEILCETQSKRIIFIVGRLFPDGNLYIITAYWADSELSQLYLQEREVSQND